MPIQRSRVAGLDLIRGLAIGLVLLRHAAPSAFGGAGIVGVVVFFTLSGYLITGVLLHGLERDGHVDYRRFYRNRLLRLVPALTAVVMTYAVAAAAFRVLEGPEHILPTLLVAVTYTADLPLGLQISTGLSHLWTLAVEEQFYLLWPLVLAFAYRRAQPTRLVVASGIGLWVTSALSVAALHGNVQSLYMLPTSWASTLAIGAVGFLHRDRLAQWGARPSAPPVAAACLLALLAFGTVPDAKSHGLSYLVGGPLIAGCTLVLIAVVGRWQELPHRALLPLLGLGTISYAAYLWNYLIVVWLGNQERDLYKSALSVLLTLVAATVSWLLIERRVSRWRERQDRRSAVLHTAPSRLVMGIP